MSGTSSNAKYGKPRKGTGERYSDTFKGFVDIVLDDQARDDVQLALESRAFNTAEFLADLMQEGYKFSLAFDAAHSCYIATATGKAKECENNGYALSGRGPSAEGAIAVLHYKVGVLANWGSWIEQGTQLSQQLPLWR